MIEEPCNWDFANGNVITLSTYAGSGNMSVGVGGKFGWVASGA
jgi:hypothetical protein